MCLFLYPVGVKGTVSRDPDGLCLAQMDRTQLGDEPLIIGKTNIPFWFLDQVYAFQTYCRKVVFCVWGNPLTYVT